MGDSAPRDLMPLALLALAGAAASGGFTAFSLGLLMNAHGGDYAGYGLALIVPFAGLALLVFVVSVIVALVAFQLDQGDYARRVAIGNRGLVAVLGSGVLGLIGGVVAGIRF